MRAGLDLELRRVLGGEVVAILILALRLCGCCASSSLGRWLRLLRGEAEVGGRDCEEEAFDGVEGAVREDVDCVDDVVEEGLGERCLLLVGG